MIFTRGILMNCRHICSASFPGSSIFFPTKLMKLGLREKQRQVSQEKLKAIFKLEEKSNRK